MESAAALDGEGLLLFYLCGTLHKYTLTSHSAQLSKEYDISLFLSQHYISFIDSLTTVTEQIMEFDENKVA